MATFNGRLTGTFGAMSSLSFYPAPNIGYNLKVTDLQAGLETAAHQIDTDIAQAQ